MDYETLLYEQRGGIAHIKLNRPEKLNAISATLAAEFLSTMARFDRDEDAWVAIVSGQGRCFSAGADISAFGPDLAGSRIAEFSRGPLGRSRNWKPVIAAVHGYCFGAALKLAMDSDIVVATEDAVFRVAEAQRGLGGANYGLEMGYLGCGKVGMDLALTGRDLSGAEAHRLGFAARLTAGVEEMLACAGEIADRILDLPPLSVRANVRLSRTSKELALAPLHLLGSSVDLIASEDFAEASRAFVEKRRPVFKAR